MALGLHSFCLCLVLHGALGHSQNNLEEKIEKLEKKLELMHDVVTQLNSENDDLKTRVKALEHLVIDGNNFENYQREPLRRSGNSNEGQMTFADKTNIPENEIDNNLVEQRFRESEIKDRIPMERKRIASFTQMGVVAFHAYLSHDSSGPLPMHHILKYDMIPLNKGNGYSDFDGIFIVPTSGTYVFTWSIMCDVHGSLYTELMRNAEIIGTRFADSFRASVWDFATGTVVVDVNQGDHLYVRLGETSIGIVRSITKSKTTFSGWLLS